MRIVSREEFLKLPPNTVYSKYEPCIFSEIEIKMESLDTIDFFTQRIHDAIDAGRSYDETNILFRADETGESFRMDFDSIGRDGMFNQEERYAVWEKEDVQQLIDRLKQCL